MRENISLGSRATFRGKESFDVEGNRYMDFLCCEGNYNFARSFPRIDIKFCVVAMIIDRRIIIWFSEIFRDNCNFRAVLQFLK